MATAACAPSRAAPCTASSAPASPPLARARPAPAAARAPTSPDISPGRAHAPPPPVARSGKSPGTCSAVRSASRRWAAQATGAGSALAPQRASFRTYTEPRRRSRSRTSNLAVEPRTSQSNLDIPSLPLVLPPPLGPRPPGTRGHRLSHSAPPAARPLRPLRQHPGRPGPQRGRKDRAAQVDARPLAAPRRPARLPHGPAAARRVRSATRPARPELAALGPGRRPDGPHQPPRTAAAIRSRGPEAGARGAGGDRGRRARRTAPLRALGRPAPARAHRPGHRRRAGAPGARRADQRDGSGRRARPSRAGRAAQARAQPVGGAGDAPADRGGRVRDRGRPGRPRARALRDRPRARDDDARAARPPLRPGGARRRAGRPDRNRDRARSRARRRPRPGGRPRTRGRRVTGFAEFWAGRELWREPLLAGVLAGGLLSYLGVFVVLRRMVFVSAALSEISGVGVATAFYVGAVAGIDPHTHRAIPLLLEPVWFSLVFACAAAALFSLRPGHRKLAPETIVGLGYIVASALVLAILNSPRIAQEAHAVG